MGENEKKTQQTLLEKKNVNGNIIIIKKNTMRRTVGSVACSY